MRNTINFILIACLLLIGCINSDKNKKEEGFYDYSQAWDLYRVPLIDPYQLTSSDKGHSWMLKRGSEENVVHKAGIKDSIIVVFSRRTNLIDGMSQAWFVWKAKEKEKVLKTEDEYKAYLKSIGIDSIHLYDINQIFTDFDRNKKLPPEWPKDKGSSH